MKKNFFLERYFSLALILFLQGGGNGVIAVSTAGLLIYCMRSNLINKFWANLDIFLALLFLMNFNLIEYASEKNFIEGAARSIRISLVAIFAVIFLKENMTAIKSTENITWLIKSSLVFIYSFVIIQFVGIQLGFVNNIFLPQDFFGSISSFDEDSGLSQTTIQSYWIEFADEKNLALGQDFKIRASAFYSEPSYAGFIVFSLIFSYSRLYKDKLHAILYLSGLIIEMLCQTSSGVMITGLFLMYDYMRIKKPDPISILVVIVLFLATAMALFGDRLLNIGDASAELSGFIRLVRPFLNMSDLIADYKFFGVPPYYAASYFPSYQGGVYVGSGLDNSLLNIFIYYGVFGFPIIFLLKKLLPRDVFLYMLAIFQFNGSAFGYDKAFVYFLVGSAIVVGNNRKFVK